MQDTADVLSKLEWKSSNTKLLAIVANLKGAQDACRFPEISYLGFPFSVSETFQQRNTNSSIDESFKRVEEINTLCKKHNKKLVVYLSMAFGNPYGDAWHPDIVTGWAKKLHEKLGIEIISLADTIGVSTPANITLLFKTIIPEFKQVEIGAHLHTTPNAWKEKLQALLEQGCVRIDGALKGYGGCPMAKDDLTGNMATEKIIEYCESKSVNLPIDKNNFYEALEFTSKIFH